MPETVRINRCHHLPWLGVLRWYSPLSFCIRGIFGGKAGLAGNGDVADQIFEVIVAKKKAGAHEKISKIIICQIVPA